MKRRLIYILLAVAVMSLAGCRSARQVQDGTRSADVSYSEVVRKLAAEPPVTEMTAKISATVRQTSLSGQIRMRWNECVQVSVNLLGLAEIARVEFLPDKIVVVDRVNRRYSVCSYADFPGRNYTGLEFNVVQSLFWNKMFAPGKEGIGNVVASMRLENSSESSMTLKEGEYGFLFNVRKANNLLTKVSKSAGGSGIQMEYSSFARVADNLVFPTVMDIDIDSDQFDESARIVLSGIDTGKGSWASQSKISSSLKKVELETLINGILR